jgi:hypothetical protein
MSVERELLERLLTSGLFEAGLYEDWEQHIKALLAQPEHVEDKLAMVEPVAWMYERETEDFTERTLSVGFEKDFDGITIPLYTAPPKREPLSYEHLEALADEFEGCPMTLGRAVEEAHGIGGDNG